MPEVGQWTMVAVWIAAIVLLVVLEGATVALVCIWFAGGALAALIFAAVGFGLEVQFAAFIIVSGALLLITRPLVRKKINFKKQATNADAVVGSTAIVVEKIDNIEGVGQVKAGGQYWTARSENGRQIRKDAYVHVIRIEGVKLIVRELAEDEPALMTMPEKSLETV